MSPLDASSHVVVVGAGLAGWRTVEALRDAGFDGALTLVGEESHPPYDRPPLSKQVLSGRLGPDILPLERRPVEVVRRFGVAATALDAGRRRVWLSDGSEIAATHVVVATGARARRLEVTAAEGVHTLRTRDDLDRLLGALERLGPGDRVAVIGGGFIGAEVATALHARGLVPIVVEALARPLIGALGPRVSAWLMDLPSRADIEVRCRQVVRDVVPRASGWRVELAEGDLDVDLVVAGIGADPNVEWLAGSGLEIDRGVVVDEQLEASEGVAAVGDVARFAWAGPLGLERIRVEHWQVAADHALALASWWTGRGAPAPLVPYFWSDQYGTKIQLLGHPHADDEVDLVLGQPTDDRWLALYHRGGRVSGAVARRHPRALMLARPLVEVGTPLDEALRAAPWAG